MTSEEAVKDLADSNYTDAQIVAFALLEVARAIRDLGFGNEVGSHGTLEFIGMQLRDVGGALVQAVHGIGGGAESIAVAIEGHTDSTSRVANAIDPPCP